MKISNIARIRTALLHATALEKASDKNYEKSLADLRKIYKILGLSAPSAVVVPDTNMLFSLLSFKLNDFLSSNAAAEIAFHQLSEKKWKYTEEERKYLKYYCRILLEYCSDNLGGGGRVDEIYAAVNFSSLDFNKVDSRFRRNFPIRQASSFETNVTPEVHSNRDRTPVRGG